MQRRIQKYRHACGTAIFLLSAGYLFILALRQAGAQWWLIFSLSGPSIIIALILISIYLLAVYRGAVRNTMPSEIEHPLTRSSYYMIFYDICPFLGSLGGIMGMIGTGDFKEYFTGIAYATVAATFLVWIILDPAIGFLETMTPASRRHRQLRHTQERKAKQQKQLERDKILKEVQAEEKKRKLEWKNLLRPQALKLAHLATSSETKRDEAEGMAIDIGVSAWRSGGIPCMELLHQMAQEQRGSEKKGNGSEEVDYISQWWDGIGQWHHQPFSSQG